MAGQSERRLVVNRRFRCRVVRGITPAVLLLAAVGCRAVDLQNPWEIYYDAGKYGTAEEDIDRHFNMHRGRWWNYYTRGACYLEYGHWEKARDDFATAIAVRGDVETRNARTYGMHFMDYFPRRETGIAYYFEGRSKTGESTDDGLVREAGEKLLNQAIEALKESLRQEESSRAKHYLNQAGKALWAMRRNDGIPPVIRVNEPIYTNERTVRFGVTVTDDQSGVEEIRIRAPDGGVRIDAPRLLVELAREEVTEAVELTIDSLKTAAVVEITALDLAGNESAPYRVHIVLDTQAPVAAVTIIGDMQPQGRVAAFVRAVDNSGLREIQAGGDENDRFGCYGRRRYSGTVIGTPAGGELGIKVIDNAGNAVFAGVPIGEGRGLARLSRVPWRQTPWVIPLMERVAVHDWNRRFPPGYELTLGVSGPRSLGALRWDGHHQTASVASLRVWAAGEATGQSEPQFCFQPHVRPPGGKAKETSQDFFVVEGTLRNAEGVTRITVDGADIDPNMLKNVPPRGGDDLLFSHTVDLADTPVGQPRQIAVKAFREERPCAEDILLTVIRRKNCTRDPDAVYQVVFLLGAGSTPFRQTIWHNTIPEQVYQVVFDSLKSLRSGPEPYGRESAERLGMHDVATVLGEDYEDAKRRSVGTVAARCRHNYDLIIHGDVTDWRGGGEKGLQVTLKAVDISSPAPATLRFPSTETVDPTILAETYIPGEASDQRLDLEKWRKLMHDLASKAMEKLPRVQADVLDYSGTSESTVTINRGADHGLCQRMGLCFYTYGDHYGQAARSRNVYLKRIGQGRIADLDRQSSQIHPQLDLRVENGLLAITK